jgi:hypothetical protein
MGLQPKCEEVDLDSILPALRPEGDLSSRKGKAERERIPVSRVVISV